MTWRAHTKFRKIADHYERLIRTGELKPGHRLVTEPKLARELGVARTTLRRAFGILVRKGLITRKPGHGTFVASASELAERSRGAIAVLAPGVIYRPSDEPDNPVMSSSGGANYHFLEGVTTTLASYGRSTRMYYLHGDQNDRSAMARQIQENGDIGVIAMSLDSSEAVDDVMSLELPAVLIDSVKGKAKVDTVHSTNRKGMKEATLYLLKNTPGPLAFVGSVRHQPPNPHNERHRGFVDACREFGCEVPDDYVLFAAVHVNGGRDIAREILKLSPLPTGIVCSDDRVAMGILDVLRDANVSVPDDVSIIAYGGTIISLMVIPTISTVSPNHLLMGETAVHLLEKRLRMPGRRPRTIHVPTKLLLRGSTIPVSRSWTTGQAFSTPGE
ncbi:MAG: hypothetical protein AMS16_04945 [Planctomycetes bacterium DG_58]|nr:MAG: hypothetical protein AMS16_04945 [Planctomycetes bacterium DG_58]KPL02213.1 MAG: hypothetical protein AMK75_03065 [Planctomycetes bacterium SM23_65]